MKTVIPLLVLLLAACNSSSTTPPGDLARPQGQGCGNDSLCDLAIVVPPSDLTQPADLVGVPVPDLTGEVVDLTGSMDLSRSPDLLGVNGCRVDGDCRLFSSYCSTAACVCFPLRKSDPDPVCNGMIVRCLMDPCQGKTATCDVNSGRCLAK